MHNVLERQVGGDNFGFAVSKPLFGQAVGINDHAGRVGHVHTCVHAVHDVGKQGDARFGEERVAGILDFWLCRSAFTGTLLDKLTGTQQNKARRANNWLQRHDDFDGLVIAGADVKDNLIVDTTIERREDFFLVNGSYFAVLKHASDRYHPLPDQFREHFLEAVVHIDDAAFTFDNQAEFIVKTQCRGK